MKMRASTYYKYGSPNEVLKLEEIDKPTLHDNDLLVKVIATTVNRTDCHMLSGKPWVMHLTTGLFKPTNPVLGSEFSGIVEAIGQNVTKFNVGDKVFGFDDMGLSSHGEYLCIEEKEALATIPDNIPFPQAAASTEGAHYAYNFINKVPLKKGDQVLVYGASGAIGSAMVQLLKAFYTEVTAVCNTVNLTAVKNLGADHVIDYTQTDFTKIDQQFDYVFDAVGKTRFSICRPLMKPKAVFMSSELGPHGENIFYSLISYIWGHIPGSKGKKKVKFPYPKDRLTSVKLVQKLMNQGLFSPLIDRYYELDCIADAFEYAASGQKSGNLVINIGSEKE